MGGREGEVFRLIMSVLITSNIVKHSSGFPIGGYPMLQLSPLCNAMEYAKIPYVTLYGQESSRDNWVKSIQDTNHKIVLIGLDVPFLHSLKEIKADLTDRQIIVFTEDQELIDVLINDYEVDYVCFGLAGLLELIRTAIQPFSPFFDHVPCIAYKNGLGEITKTDFKESQEDFSGVNTNLFQGHAPEIQAYENVLTELFQYKSDENYDAYCLKIPSSKKALKQLGKIIDENSIHDNLFLFPSCDVEEDKSIYHKMHSFIEYKLELKNASLFRKWKLNRLISKLNLL